MITRIKINLLNFTATIITDYVYSLHIHAGAFMKKIFSVFLILLLSSITFSQILDEQYFKDNHEVYFKFTITDRTELNTLTRIISIDNLEGNIVYAYANEKELIITDRRMFLDDRLLPDDQVPYGMCLMTKKQTTTKVENLFDW
jgi:hypothetical protein